MNTTRKRKPPGKLMRIISFLPMLNWFALVYLGLKCCGPISVISGVIYGILVFKKPDIAPLLWIVVMIQYAIACSMAETESMQQAVPPPSKPPKVPQPKVLPPKDIIVESEIVETRDIIPQQQEEQKTPEQKFTLNFESINKLREESESVRDALEVKNTNQENEEEIE